jgi:hypothetical protein
MTVKTILEGLKNLQVSRQLASVKNDDDDDGDDGDGDGDSEDDGDDAGPPSSRVSTRSKRRSDGQLKPAASGLLQADSIFIS